MITADYRAEEHPAFGIERKGYSKTAVDRYVREVTERLTSQSSKIEELEPRLSDAERTLQSTTVQLNQVTAERDRLARRSDDQHTRLQSAQWEITRLTRELNEMISAPNSNTAIGNRIERMLTLAGEEATHIHHRAESAAEEIIAAATAKAEKLTAELEERRALMEIKQQHTENEYAELMRSARADAARISSESIADRDAADIEANARRAHLEETLNTALAVRRTEAEAAIKAQEAAAANDIEQRLHAAESEAHRLLREAETETAQLWTRTRMECAQLGDLRDDALNHLVEIREHLDQLPQLSAWADARRHLESSLHPSGEQKQTAAGALDVA
ncbi:hypothetical protein [Rhodococcus erythropolis]|jgi:hypothetical protein|uniref:hypothetical protein n=1 Tax=Rhodococcus erythropolis TaxID=1833 RepID=UPI0008781336|nr:hypothetical protein [Rhodococcus erythropolis]MDF2470038.1 myosin [Rhodococcus erythropolis]OFV75554.1 chromosome partition protein Smc [Rhodococcus erythropolis]